METKIAEVCRTVLKRVTPPAKERAEVEALARRLEKDVASAAKEFGVETKVRVEGSVAKDTWLSREPDVDIFMRLPASIPRESLGEVSLKIARKATEGCKQVERFAEHPYLEAFVDDTTLNIVPCYDVKRGEWLSATDRTPFHTDYMKKRLNGHLRGQVRLLKKFMKGIGIYGAEIRVGGFSGYLCELLILHFGSFENVLKSFAAFRRRTVIDIENHYAGRENELELLFKEPLVIVDPVDKGRNVSSAVRPEKLEILAASARAFLENPSLRFFYPSETTPLKTPELRQRMRRRGSALVFVVFKNVDVVPDILWGQLYKSQRSLRKLVQLNDFSLLRDEMWSDEKTMSAFVFELEQRTLSSVKKHLGPPLEREHECGKFLAKYKNNPCTMVGPYVEDGRWVVQIKRKYTDVVEMLQEKLKDGGRTAGVADKVSRMVREGFTVYVNEDVAKVYAKNGEFAKFLTDFLSGRPKWLDNVA